jgi:hypothetical protein
MGSNSPHGSGPDSLAKGDGRRSSVSSDARRRLEEGDEAEAAPPAAALAGRASVDSTSCTISFRKEMMSFVCKKQHAASMFHVCLPREHPVKHPQRFASASNVRTIASSPAEGGGSCCRACSSSISSSERFPTIPIMYRDGRGDEDAGPHHRGGRTVRQVGCKLQQNESDEDRFPFSTRV